MCEYIYICTTEHRSPSENLIKSNEEDCCEDVIKSKLVYTVLMRPKIRPKHVSAVTQRHVKNNLFIYICVYRLSFTCEEENEGCCASTKWVSI